MRRPLLATSRPSPSTMPRRELLVGAGWTTAGLLAGCSKPRTGQTVLPGPAVPPAALARDEAFWTLVRDQFELDPEWVVLVTVVRGTMSRSTRLCVETERRDKLHSGRARVRIETGASACARRLRPREME